MLVLVLVPNQGQAQALGAGVHQAKPWPWEPVIELAQAQRWCSPGKALAVAAGAELVGTAPWRLPIAANCLCPL